jgi:fucose 4-O-acetylase-like acetyltransferase
LRKVIERGTVERGKRVDWIDVAKGLGITLVSFGHLSNGDGQAVWLPALSSVIVAIFCFICPCSTSLAG